MEGISNQISSLFFIINCILILFIPNIILKMAIMGEIIYYNFGIIKSL